jgi:hypothetical protein
MAPTLRGRPVSFRCQKVALEKNATPLERAVFIRKRSLS